MNKKLIILTVVTLVLFLVGIFVKDNLTENNSTSNPAEQTQKLEDPLMISVMRAKDYPGSDLKIEETLEDGVNYNQYIVSYYSEGLKIYGLLTVPTGEKPQSGWPAIIFNHGYIPPSQYQTTERYGAYVDAFARNGYVVFKPDFRGHGLSEGSPEGAYYSSAYATDALNALSSIKEYPGVNPDKIGMWGHSMGGSITLRSLVTRPDTIKAAVIWAGVVGTYDDLMNNWRRRVPFSPDPQQLASRTRRRADLVKKYGTPKDNPVFWNSVDSNFYLAEISAPVELHAGTADDEVPWEFSKGLEERLKGAGKTVEFFTYEGADHNISNPSFDIAMQRSVDFFDKYLK